jgi:hypothetical protein
VDGGAGAAGGDEVTMGDPYETGTPKYSTAASIYDGLVQLTTSEEMQILTEMFPDVMRSDQQGYYYYDKGSDLKDKFEALTDYGSKFWIMDLALWQIENNNTEGGSGAEIHDLVYQVLMDEDMAKRIGLKKIFVDHLLRGDAKQYAKVSELFAKELSDLDRFDFYEMVKAFNRAMEQNGTPLFVTSPYPVFAHYFVEKVTGLKLSEETRLLTESRALLTSYDDFMLGLRMNQTLYETQERMYKQKMQALQAAYEEKVKRLYAIAENVGVLDAFNEVLALPGGTVDSNQEAASAPRRC